VKYDCIGNKEIQTKISLCSKGVGKFFVKFENVIAAKKARYRISGKQYNGRTVVASFYPEDFYDHSNFDLCWIRIYFGFILF